MSQEIDEYEKPIITLKMAFDANGAVDERSNESERFTSNESLDKVHCIRRDNDAILVGIGTIVRDNPSLTVRRVPLAEGQSQPLRVILDRSLRIPDPDHCTALNDGNPTVVFFVDDPYKFTKAKAAEIMISSLGMPVTVVDVESDGANVGCSIERVIDILAKKGVRNLMIEGGPNVAKQFLEKKLVDRAVIIKSAIAFKEPFMGDINHSTLEKADMNLIGGTKWGVDDVEFWSKSGFEFANGEFDKWP
eukprot:CAMPEP_0171459624 /NCGR_PEP_ID=MMETSP0945-20130129/4832_1 /TAXON_ID=109269 /ORGANISM="Vaucheria litorea, Strain CCMP2940" /LENGTH=247 /DNA_ID=CAMNT_0011985677 /DNA_START=123 /DNA_END=866 /DNA_ORIENTATION=-